MIRHDLLTLIARNCADDPFLATPQAWSALLQPEVHSAFLPISGAAPPQPLAAAPHAASVFRAVIEAALRDAATGAHEVRKNN